VVGRERESSTRREYFELHPTTLIRPSRCKALFCGSSKRSDRVRPGVRL
jgi:hypothetical protein